MRVEKSTAFGSWTLSEILEGRYFRVPDYQRGYAWSSRQLEEFWEDLSAVEKSGGRHYTGAITVEALPDSSEFTLGKGFEVVDGQQRLTTIAILLSTLGSDYDPFIMKEQGGIHYRFSYGENNDDLRFLRDILSGNELRFPENSHQRNLRNAREFFRSKTDGWAADQKRKIADVLMSRLTFDFRILGSDYNSGVIFETMNNRGKPLTLLEKLKNRLMYLTSTISVEGDEESSDMVESEKARLREEIDDAWGRIYRLLASNPQSDPLDEDEYVAAHLSVYRAPKESVYSKTVAESRLFKMFCTNAECHPKSERIDENDKAAVAKELKEETVSIKKIRDYVGDLVGFAEPWAKLHRTSEGPLGRCRLFSGTQEVKVFLATILLHADNEETKNSILENAELILFRNTIRSVMDEATFATLARRLHGKCLDMLRKGDNTQIDMKGVEESLHAIVDDERRQLGVGFLVDYFAGLMVRQQSPYGFYGWKGLKYFLFKQEGCEGLDWSRYDETTLEHVMPQSSTDKDNGWWIRQVQEFTSACGYGTWDVLSDKERKACRQCRRNLVNSLGNFVLLTQSENASVSDAPWESYPAVEGVHRSVVGKKAFYSNPNNISSSGARCVAQDDGAWNAFRIRERGRELFKKLVIALGATGDLVDESVDLAIGFDTVKSLEDSSFEALPDNDVARLAPRLETAAESVEQKKKKDTTKYNFNGKVGLKQQEMVEAVIRQYLKDKPSSSFEELQKAFPQRLQGTYGCVCKVSDIVAPERFRPEHVVLMDGTEIAICSQWGRAWGNGNIPRFLDGVRKLGYLVEEITPEPSEDMGKENDMGKCEGKHAVIKRRDTTKYRFKGKVGLKQQEMVEAVIRQYLKDKPSSSFEELQEAFPQRLQGTYGCVCKVSDIVAPERFRPGHIVLMDGTEIAICSQWGRAWGTGNIPRFLERARELGYEVEEIPPEKP